MALPGISRFYPFPPQDKEQEKYLGSYEGHAGHPTVPGELDPSIPRMSHRVSPGSGRPGTPRIATGPRHTAGLPGNAPSGPIQPGTKYAEGEDKGGK